MDEYIEREALAEDLRGSYEELRKIYNGLRYDEERRICSSELTSFMECIIRVKEAPTADVVEVRHGSWKRLPFGMFFCSECRELQKKRRFLPNYCHQCGAKMDGKGDGE